MKIAFLYDTIYPYARGGAERRYWELALQLRSKHEVHMISWQYWDGPAHFSREGISFHGLGRPRALYTRAGIRSMREALEFGLCTARLAPLARFDLIDCSSFPFFHTYLTRLITKWRRTSLVVTWHEYWGEYWYEYLGRAKGELARVVERTVVPLADRYIAVSDHTAERLVSLGGCRGPITVVPNGIDFDSLSAPRSRTSEWDVLYVGRLLAHKRVDVLLRALALLRNRSLPVRCLIVGSGPETVRLRGLTHQLHLDEQVSFAGQLTDGDVQQAMWSSRVFVLPSQREGFGMAVLEAAACGLASIVATGPLTASPELVEDGVTGVLSEATPLALADAIESVLSDTSVARRMGDAAQVWAREYDWSRVSERALAVYEASA